MLKIKDKLDDLIDILVNDDVSAFEEEAPCGFFLFPPDAKLNEFFVCKPNLVALAAYYGALKCLTYLKNCGQELINCDELGRDAIHFAAANNQTQIVEYLCETFSYQYNQDNELLTPLHYAVMKNAKQVINVLIDKKVNIDARDCYGMTPLHYANDDSIANILLENECKIDARSVDGVTPLCMAAKRGYKNVVDILLKNKANQKTKSREGWSVFHFAAMSGDIKTIRLLYKYNKDINLLDCCGRSPLHYAAEEGNALVTYFFIKHGCDPNLQDKQGITPIHFAASQGNISAAKMLINYGAKVDLVDVFGRSCQHFAALSDNSDTIDFFSKSLPTDIKTNHGAIPLHIAAASDCPNTVEKLAKDNIDQDSFYGKTPLVLAAELGSTSAIQVLLKNGATVNVHDRTGLSPIDKAILVSSEQAVTMLSYAGAIPSPVWSKRSTRASSQSPSSLASPALRSRISPNIISFLSQ